MNMLSTEPPKACYESMDSENCDPNLEELQRAGRVKELVNVFENMKLLPETQKIEIKGTHKAFNKKDNSNGGELGQDTLKPNGCVERRTIAEVDQPLAKKQTNILSGKSCGSFDRHCNMAKHEDGISSDLSDTQSIHSVGPSESSSRSRRRQKSFDSTERGSPIWKNWAEQRKKQVRATPKKPFRLLTEQRGEMKDQRFMKKMQQKMKEEEKRRIPIAQGLPCTIDEPQVLPKPPVKEHTKPSYVRLHTQSRAAERAKFDHSMEEKFNYLEQQRLEEQRLRKLAEEEGIQRLRKKMVPVAQLMPFFDRPFTPKKSSKSPTIPKEPKFHSHHHHTKCLT